MSKDYPIQVLGQICWLPPRKPEKKRFPPGRIFRADARFTSNIEPIKIAQVNYSPNPEIGQECYRVRLNFASWKKEEIEKLIRNSEILIMEGYIVLAVCRNLSINKEETGKMEDDWD